MAYLRRAAADNVRHAEIFFDPQGHTARGIAFKTVIDGLWRALGDARQELGITASLILCFLRHLDEASAERTLDEALPWRDRIVGVDGHVPLPRVLGAGRRDHRDRPVVRPRRPGNGCGGRGVVGQCTQSGSTNVIVTESFSHGGTVDSSSAVAGGWRVRGQGGRRRGAQAGDP